MWIISVFYMFVCVLVFFFLGGVGCDRSGKNKICRARCGSNTQEAELGW